VAAYEKGGGREEGVSGKRGKVSSTGGVDSGILAGSTSSLAIAEKPSSTPARGNIRGRGKKNTKGKNDWCLSLAFGRARKLSRTSS